MQRTLVRAVLGLMVLASSFMAQHALAAGGDFQLDFVASAPFTYDHATGGGAYDDRTVGKTNDIVESLEGGDFACFELVSFLTQITVETGAFNGPQTIDLDYVWTADTTGQSGGALDEVQSLGINYGVIAGGVGDGPGGTDGGISDDGGSTASLIATDYTQATFSKGAEHKATIRVTDLEPGETVVVRFELDINCDGRKPTGNLQARLAGARVFAPASEVGSISVGDQTIPFKHINQLKPPPPPK